LPDNRKPLKYGAFPVCRNYTVRAHVYHELYRIWPGYCYSARACRTQFAGHDTPIRAPLYRAQSPCRPEDVRGAGIVWEGCGKLSELLLKAIEISIPLGIRATRAYYINFQTFLQEIFFQWPWRRFPSFPTLLPGH